MNPKRLIGAIPLVFAGVWLTDFLIHGVWLQSDYRASMDLWRPEVEMEAHLGWLMAGQLLFASMFVLLWAKGFAASACIRCACSYGLCMGLFSQAATLVTYAVQPFPANIAVKWFMSGAIQGVLLGLLVFVAYKPRREPGAIGHATAVEHSSAP